MITYQQKEETADNDIIHVFSVLSFLSQRALSANPTLSYRHNWPDFLMLVAMLDNLFYRLLQGAIYFISAALISVPCLREMDLRVREVFHHTHWRAVEARVGRRMKQCGGYWHPIGIYLIGGHRIKINIERQLRGIQIIELASSKQPIQGAHFGHALKSGSWPLSCIKSKGVGPVHASKFKSWPLVGIQINVLAPALQIKELASGTAKSLSGIDYKTPRVVGDNSQPSAGRVMAGICLACWGNGLVCSETRRRKEEIHASEQCSIMAWTHSFVRRGVW